MLTGQVELFLADTSTSLGPGDAAEFDTHTPHWFGASGDTPAEVLLLSGGQGERVRLRTPLGTP